MSCVVSGVGSREKKSTKKQENGRTFASFFSEGLHKEAAEKERNHHVCVLNQAAAETKTANNDTTKTTRRQQGILLQNGKIIFGCARVNFHNPPLPPTP